LGDDAEYLASLGFAVTAFDVSPTAIAWCRKRFPESNVEYLVADLLSLPALSRHGFDLVVECYTIQSLPPDDQARAMMTIVRQVSADGRLLIVCDGRDTNETVECPPWPLSRDSLHSFEKRGLTQIAFEDLPDDRDMAVRRFLVEYRQRPA
jgi:ubiquinone/menaquinone biosynthesis C-methylase UbiE